MNHKTLPNLDRLAPLQRRRFMKRMSALLAAPAIPPGIRYALDELVIGTAHAQQTVEPTFFIEINFRDQVDFGQICVAPGLAKNNDLKRGEKGDAAAIFFRPEDMTQLPGTDVFLTPQSMELAPHMDNVAFIDTTELTPGEPHYHNGANFNRIPGASQRNRAGLEAVYLRDKTTKFPGGNTAYYGNTPTPASFHNYIQKKFTPDGAGLKNGLAFKGIFRSIHTVYQFGASLPGAELERIQKLSDMFKAFPDAKVGALHALPTEDEARFLSGVLSRVDPGFLRSRRFSQTAVNGHMSEVEAAGLLLHNPNARSVDLPLTDEEREYWREGVPEVEGGRVAGTDSAKSGNTEFQIWEQFAYAFKLLGTGLTRTVALECEFPDLHGSRPERNMEVYTLQSARPLSRLISQLKEAGMWDRTVIAMYTTDGSRPVSAGHSGDRGKNTFVLAGGNINGGYYGDMRVAGNKGNGHSYSYHAPDPVSGRPDNQGDTGNKRRLNGAHTWRTVMKALRIPDEHVNQFDSVRDYAPMPFLLKS